MIRFAVQLVSSRFRLVGLAANFLRLFRSLFGILFLRLFSVAFRLFSIATSPVQSLVIVRDDIEIEL